MNVFCLFNVKHFQLSENYADWTDVVYFDVGLRI